VFNGFHNASVTLVKPDGSRIDGIPAVVQPKLIIIDNAAIPVEEGDVIERTLPSGVVERYTVVDPGFHDGLGIPAHYQIRFKRAPRSSATASSFAAGRKGLEGSSQAANNAQMVGPSHVVAPAALVDLAIITILPEEYSSVLACLSNRRAAPGSASEPNVYGWELGEVQAAGHAVPYTVVVALAGDPTNAIGALVTKKTVEIFLPRYVALVGVAGGLPTEAQTRGDVMISSVIHAYEYGKIDESGFRPRSNFTYRVDRGLVMAALALDAGGPEWRVGITPGPDPAHRPRLRAGEMASGDKVVDDATGVFFQAVLNYWPKLLGVEMEGAGAAAAIEAAHAEGRQVGFVMIRGVSDMPISGAEPQSGGTAERDRWKPYAAGVAARFVCELLRNRWPVPPRASLVDVQRPAAKQGIKGNRERDALRSEMLSVSSVLFGKVPEQGWWHDHNDAQIPGWLDVLAKTIVDLGDSEDGRRLRDCVGILKGRIGRAMKKVEAGTLPDIPECQGVAQAINDVVGALMRIEF
jgi:nucleoside phosphorylase